VTDEQFTALMRRENDKPRDGSELLIRVYVYVILALVITAGAIVVASTI
jgi:hypothetical protein